MRFGLFYEHQLPRPCGPDDERRLVQDALEHLGDENFFTAAPPSAAAARR